MPADVIVVGAGVSGLAAAWHLAEAGCRVALVEESDRVGGAMRTSRVEGPGGGYLVEHGPNSFSNRPSAAVDLARAVGLGDELVGRRARDEKRYLYDGRTLREVPMGPVGLATTPLLSWRGKFRAAIEPLVGGVPAPDDDVTPDVSLGDWVASHFGAELLDAFVTPLVSGIYAADPRAISLRSTFPAIWEKVRGRRRLLLPAGRRRPAAPPAEAARGRAPRPPRELVALRDGNASLAAAIERALRARGAHVVCGAAITLEAPETEGGDVVVRTRSAEGAQEFVAPALVMATPARAAARLLAGPLPALASLLDAVRYAPLAIAHVAAPADSFGRPLDGFGFLVPRGRGVRLLGAIWSSAMFPGRAPAGYHLLTCFLGGQLDPDAATLADGPLLALLREELTRVFERPAPLPLSLVQAVRWERALPLYLTGYPSVARGLRSGCPPWLRLVGNYLEAISVPDCIRRARETAADLAAAHRLPRSGGVTAPPTSVPPAPR